MVAGMHKSMGQNVFGTPKTIEEFENVMKKVVNASKEYKRPQETKKIIVHDPAKNPFAPLYRPDREVIFVKDKYHATPMLDLRKEVKPEKPLRFAVGAGGIPPEKDPSMYNNIDFEKYNNIKNNKIMDTKDSYNYNKKVK